MSAADITPTTAVLELAKLSRELDAAGERLKDAERKAVNRRHEFNVANAKALLVAEGANAQERAAKALLDTQDAKISAELAEAELRIVRADVKILENRIDVGRSVVGVLRAEAQVVR